ncbi:hypothetical protein [Amycolatopsis sp. YIM 10]|uniref:hypothetical protein n=1 Tax=Amycolatopsis sp. YIM 10 TaxID=2653857 RepID=UPI0012905CE8|nr:hypothetical protein [Amycolatopsis sp. YIM 10]QFU91928.1 hypothetical protein YIM_33835 [Amycolatopsis sp. YIM 10]
MGKRWERRRRRLVRRLSEAGPVGGALAVLLSLGKAECSGKSGGGWQRGDVVLRVSSREEAFAAEPRLEPQWSTPQRYRSEDGSIVVGAAGFPGTPKIRDLRARYGKGRLQ